MNVNGLPDTNAPSPFVYVNVAANSGVKANTGLGANQENGVMIRQQNIKIDDAITIQRLPVEYQRSSQQVNVVNDSQQQQTSNITIKKLTSQQIMPSALMCSVASTDESHLKKNVSSLMVSNSMLNKLLDSRPHIPTFITKAADLAHILSNPLPRQQQAGNQLADGNVSYTQPAPTMISTASHFPASDSFVPSNSMAPVGDFRTSSNATSEDRILKVVPQISDSTPILSDVQMPHSRHGKGQVQVVHVQSQPCLKVVENKPVPSAGQTVEQFTKGLVEHQRKFPSTVGADLLNTSQVSFPTVESQNLMSVSGRTQNKKSDNESLSVSNNLHSDARTFSALLQNGDLENKSSPSTEMKLKPMGLQNSVAHSNNNKTDLMTSSDPMFPSVAITSDVVLTTTPSFAPYNKTVITSSDLSVSTPSPNDSFKTQHLTLSDLLSRGPSAETLLSASSGTPLTSLSDSKLHSSDVLLSELHRNDEGDLSLGASLQAPAVVDTDGLHAAPESAHTGATDQIVVSESSLPSGITGDSSTLPGLSSLPLTGFNSLASIPPIPTDFMTAPSTANKTSPPSQGNIPALLSNLSTTTDLALSFSSNFLDNSNMSMDMSNLSESDMSLNVSGSVFGETHEKTSVTTSLSSKKITNSSSDLTFTNALKGVTSKIDYSHGLVSSVENVSRNKVEEVRKPVEDSVKSLHQNRVPLFQSEPTKLEVENIVPHCTVPKGKPSRKQMETMQTKSKMISQSPRTRKSTQDKKLEVHKKSKLLLQQVPCFKCQMCPFLIQEEEGIVQHMKEQHMDYFLQTNEEESEDDCEEEEEGPVLSGKRLKSYLTEKANGDPLDCQKVIGDDKKNFREKRSNFEMCDSTEIIGKSASKVPKVPRQIFKVEREMEDYEAEEYRFLSHSDEVSSEMKKVEPDLVHNFQNGLLGSVSESKNEYAHQVESELESERRGKSKVEEVSIKGKNGKMTKDRKGKTSLLGIRCDVNGCGLKLKQEENIEYHRKCHIGALLVCPECHTKFGHWHSLAMHLWKAHIIDMELHKCDECDYKTYSLSKLHNTHKMIHGSERPFLCDMCGKGFKTAKQMRKHKQSVHSEKSGIAHYTCNICQRQFSDKRMLRCHKDTVHDKVKRYLCNYCGYSASSNSTLKMHIRQHTGEKPFECNSCDYRTADHNSLRRHKMRHSGEKPYKCPYCSYASIQSSTYKTHIKNKHPNMAQAGGVMFMCPMCSYKTVKHDNYLAHVAEHKKKNEADKSTIATEVLVDKQDETQITTEVANAPHIFNIDVNSGAVTVENPDEQHFLDPLDFQNHLTGQLIMAGGEQYVYAAVDSSLLQVLPETGITLSSAEFAKSLRTNAFLAIPAKLEPDIIVSDNVQTESKPKTFEHQTVLKLSACEGGGGGGGTTLDEEEGKGGFANKGCKH
ncbi:uncharacterized protein LOC143029159 isoform X2 [Oratosquilla oratoria]